MNIRPITEDDLKLQACGRHGCQECGHNASVLIELQGISFDLCFRCWKKLKKKVNRAFVDLQMDEE